MCLLTVICLDSHIMWYFVFICGSGKSRCVVLVSY